MNKGDTSYITLDYTVDGTPLEEYDADEIEFYIGSSQYRLSTGDIVLDPETNKYIIFLTQNNTFKFDKSTSYQIRIRKNEFVVSDNIRKLRFGDVISRTVI